MRLYILPISTHRSLLYCRRLAPSPSSSSALNKSTTSSSTPTQQKPPNFLWQFTGELVSGNPTTASDLASAKVSSTWLKWESSPRRWQRWVTSKGNTWVLQRVGYEEWGLKSVAAGKGGRRRTEDGRGGEKKQRRLEAGRREGKGGTTAKAKVMVEYPASVWDEGKVMEAVRRYAAPEKQKEHQKWMWYSLAGLPFTLPIGLIPVLPNLPAFWLAFRAWSHWRASTGAKHIQYLLDNDLLHPSPSRILDIIYRLDREKLATRGIQEDLNNIRTMREKLVQESKTGNEHLVITASQGKLLAKGLDLPEIGPEVERAVGQIEGRLEKERGVGSAKDG